MQKASNWDMLRVTTELKFYNLIHIWMTSFLILLTVIVIIAVIVYWYKRCEAERKKIEKAVKNDIETNVKDDNTDAIDTTKDNKID